MSYESVKNTTKNFYAALRANDVEAWVSNFAENAVLEDPVGTPPRNGKAEIRKFLAGVLGLTNEFGISEDHVFINENTAAVKWTGKGVGKNGRKIQFEGIDLIEVNNKGEVISLRAFWDAEPTLAVLTA